MSFAGLLLAASMFKLTDIHLMLLRHAVVMWSPVEMGAPAIAISPLQDDTISDAAYADIARRAGLAGVDKQQINQLLREMPEAFHQLLKHGKLAAGTYKYDNPLVGVPFAANMLPEEIANLAKDEVVSFTFTDQHALLLRNASWLGLFMDAKRPYGDRTSFERDMATILKVPLDEEKLRKLHTETPPALQVYLQNAKLEPGEYPWIEVWPF